LPAIAAHVEHEGIEQWAVRDFPVDAPGFGLGLPHRHVFAKRAAAVRREQRRIGVGIVAAVLARPPGVGDLVVVPLREHRHLGVESAHVRVEKIVFVVAAVVGDRCRDPRLFLGDDILPRFAVRQLQFAFDRAVGIDAVAGMDEEVRPALQHCRIGAHAAARLVDAPALARGVTGPDERHRAPVVRSRAEAPDLRFA
jgi:hypothetical protein